MGFKDGCDFRVGVTVCKRTVSADEVRRLLANGTTSRLSGFISKNGKSFDASLVIKDGKAVFSFD